MQTDASYVDHPHTQVRCTHDRGMGVFAVAPIAAGETVAWYDGPLLPDDWYGWDTEEAELWLSHAIQVGPETWVACSGNAKLLNHSCEPNCGIKNFTRICAMRDIAAGEELTWDYEMTERSDWWEIACLCGTPSCRKYVGKGLSITALQEKYPERYSAWLDGDAYTEDIVCIKS